VDAFDLGISLVGAALAAWFWPHCAKPALRMSDARPIAYPIGLGITALLIGAFAIGLVARLAHASPLGVMIMIVTGALWMVVVGATLWPRYSILLRLFARRPGRPATR
jgi:hypothetical protein